MLTAEITYRLFTEADTEGLLRLWAESSGWGGITKEQFEAWYLNTPYAECIVVVAVDENEKVVGQLVFTPALALVGGRERKALRASAPILDKRLKNGRITSADHPVVAMLKTGVHIAKHQGYQVLYLLPAAGWTALLKLFPSLGLPDVRPTILPCFQVSMQDFLTFVPQANLSVQRLKGEFTQEYDELWAEAASTFPVHCGIVRNAKWLNWKLGAHEVFEVRTKDSNALQGYVAIKKDSGLLVDMLAKNRGALKENLQAVVHATHLKNPEGISTSWKVVKGMYTPLFRSLFPNLETVNYNFAFGAGPLHPDVQPEQLNSSQWYLMPND